MKKHIWEKFWTAPYSLANCMMFGDQYTKSCQKELGLGFSEVHFIFKNGRATVYRDSRENKNFSRKMAKLFCLSDKSEKLIKREEELYAALTSLFRKRKIYSYEFFHTFRLLYDQYLPYFIAIAWAADSLNTGHRDLPRLSKIRKSHENFYTQAENFLERYFKKMPAHKNKYLYKALTLSELEKFLKISVLPLDDLLRNRYELCLVSTINEKPKIYAGKMAQKKTTLLGLENFPLPKGKILTGIPAFPGKVTGRIHTISDTEDLKNFQAGEIMVCAMTRPDWLPVIKKAAAVITDVGGILSHAAVIARELKKPCIIGTKIATRIFKNGTAVEVDAQKGKVKILKCSRY